MEGLIDKKVPLLLRRLLTLVPALLLLAIGFDPTRTLVLSQVSLSFGIPFALIPLVMITSQKKLMGDFTNKNITAYTAWIATAIIVVLNFALIVLTLRPTS